LIGSTLYSLGGFKLPFFFVGSFATIMSFVLCLVIPNIEADPKDEKDSDKKSASFYDLLKVSLFALKLRFTSSYILRKEGKNEN